MGKNKQQKQKSTSNTSQQGAEMSDQEQASQGNDQQEDRTVVIEQPDDKQEQSSSVGQEGGEEQAAPQGEETDSTEINDAADDSQEPEQGGNGGTGEDPVDTNTQETPVDDQAAAQAELAAKPPVEDPPPIPPAVVPNAGAPIAGEIAPGLEQAPESTLAVSPTPVTPLASPSTNVPSAPAGVVTDDLDVFSKLVLQTVSDYSINMKAGRPLEQKYAMGQQLNFFGALKKLIMNVPDKDFKKVFAQVLKIIENDEHGSFREECAMRYVSDIAMSDRDRKTFQRVVHMLRTLAPVKGRELAVKSIKMSDVLAYVPEDKKQRILAYFNL